MDGRMDKRTDERKSPCVLQDFVPFGAAALLPLTQIHNHAQQGNGYRWPHIALGRPVHIIFQGVEYPAYPDAQPDVDIRRKNVVRRRGLPKQRIFFHHGEKYANNNVTLYDEKYNGRELRESTVRESEVYD